MPQEPFSRQTEAGLALHPQNAASGGSAATQRPLAMPEKKIAPSGPSVFPLAKPDLFWLRIFSSPTGWMNSWRAQARSLWGMPGGLGIASAIEPAGGVSPLRGGAGVRRVIHFARVANY